MRINITICLIVFVSYRAIGQSGDAQLTFEVASVKPSGPQSKRGLDGGPGSADPGRFFYHSAFLLDLIELAYHVEPFQISSKAPLDREKFDIDVDLPAGATRPQFRVMMQNLLAERFHLRLHTQSKEFSAYALVAAKTGLKLKEAAAGTGTRQSSVNDGFPELPTDRPGVAMTQSVNGGFELFRVRGQQEPVSTLAGMLRLQADLPIVDKSGLTGRYDFSLEFTKELPNAPEPDAPPIAPSLFTALQQQLGLQLVSKKIPFDVLMIDHIETVPTEN
jgi:uncharacterized protein (TIGR03435 family)